MKKIILLLSMIAAIASSNAQSPCSGKEYRQFDFWIGEWEVYGIKGTKAGDSRITLILDSCIILEEWTGNAMPGSFHYKGKSFNTYNKQVRQWQQTWVDNAGSTTHYIYGIAESDRIIFSTAPVMINKDTSATYRLTFFNLGVDKVRQLGEQSKDGGKTWMIQYDLEYRRIKK